MNICKRMRPPRHTPPSVFWKMAHAGTQSLGSSLFVNAPCPLCPHRKSNWIADRMKKLIKPRGGGGREGRALYTAAGSVENLADSAEFSSDTHTASPGETAQAHTHTNTGWPVCTKTRSRSRTIRRSYRHAYKSSHDYQVWSALIQLRYRYGSQLVRSLPANSPHGLKPLSLLTTGWKGKDLQDFTLFSCSLTAERIYWQKWGESACRDFQSWNWSPNLCSCGSVSFQPSVIMSFSFNLFPTLSCLLPNLNPGFSPHLNLSFPKVEGRTKRGWTTTFQVVSCTTSGLKKSENFEPVFWVRWLKKWS